MDKSLDEVIAEKKISYVGKGPRGRGGRRGGGGPMRSSGMSNGGGRFPRSMPAGQWRHDMFQNGTSRSPRPLMGGSSGMPVKLVITNLDYNVSDGDIRELFGEFGSMQTSAVHYDSNGVSLGSAQVLYTNKSAAIRAKQQYNGVHLDGRPMNISIEGDSGPSFNRSSAASFLAPFRSRGGSRRGGGERRGGFGGGERRGDGGRGGAGNRGRSGRSEKPDKTVEELDSELESYLEEAKMKKSI